MNITVPPPDGTLTLPVTDAVVLVLVGTVTGSGLKVPPTVENVDIGVPVAGTVVTFTTATPPPDAGVTVTPARNASTRAAGPDTVTPVVLDDVTVTPAGTGVG